MNHMRKLLVFSIIIGFNIATTHSSDWPKWRGPQGNGISLEKNWNPYAIQKKTNTLWKVNLGQGHSAVSIQGHYLFTQGSRTIKAGGNSTYQEVVFCLDAETGSTQWEHAYYTKPRSYNGPRATPTFDGNKLYTLGAEGQLFCFHAETGKIQWQKNLVIEGLSPKSEWGFGSSPVIVGDLLILNVGSSGLALNKNTGDVIWKSSYGMDGRSTPVILNNQGNKLVLIHTENYLVAVKPNNGKEMWRQSWRYCDGDPVVTENGLFLYGGKPLDKRSISIIDPSTGKMIKQWTKSKMNVAFQSWIAYKGSVYGITWDKKKHRLECIDNATGKSQWKKGIEDWGAITLAGDKIIFIEGNGNLKILQANPKVYKEISSTKVLNLKIKNKTAKYQPDACWTHPVLAHGKIYVRSSYGELVCLDVSE